MTDPKPDALAPSSRPGALTKASTATGGDLESLLERLKQRQAERDALAADLAQVAQPVRVEPRILERSVRTCLGDWRGLLTRQTRHGRDFLRKVLTGPITFAPLMDGASRGYQFKGEASIEQLLSGVIELPTIEEIVDDPKDPREEEANAPEHN